jgi:hypothetical protein
MRYLLLLTNSADRIEEWDAMTAEEKRRAREEEVPKWGALMERMQERGQMVSGLELDIPSTAKTVRVRDGDALVTDGPYAETREQIGGFFVVDCDGLDEAIELAALAPVAATGSVEIRPLAEEQEAPA